MRRSDREVTDTSHINDIINSCQCCRIGFIDNGSVYIVPMNFGYEKIGDTYTLYFHSAKEGRKIDLIRQNPNVGFELDTGYQLIEGSTACGFSANFRSIIGNGIIEMIDNAEEKMKALSLLMEHTTRKKEWHFNEQMINAVAVFKLNVTQLSCKEHK